jgi:hypothetical protein
MIRRPISISLLVLLWCLPAAVHAAGATTIVPHDATPTPTIAPTPPEAQTLLTLSKAAVKAANTYHISYAITIKLGALLDGALLLVGDASVTPKTSRVHITGKLAVFGKGKTLNEDDIQVGKKAWTKSAKTKHRWALGGGGAQSSGFNSSNGNPLKVTSKGDKITGLTDVGADTVNGLAVWHLHGTYVAAVDSTHTVNGTIDYYIGQADSLPVEIKAHVESTALNLLEDLNQQMTNFGEPLSIQPPTVGSTTP